MSLISFINDHFVLEAVIPKPKSINRNILEKIDKLGIRIAHLERNEIASYTSSLKSIIKSRRHRKVVIVDMGGYFAPIIEALSSELGDDLCGIVEDTQNGLERYRILPKISLPIYSVADSSLKRPENILVGLSTIESIEKVIRINAIDLNHSIFGIIGFGRIGEEVANHLRLTGKTVLVSDNSYVKRLHARSLGYRITSKTELLNQSEIIISITGGHSLTDTDLNFIKDGAIIASITSADDEFAFSEIILNQFTPFGHMLSKIIRKDGSIVYLINRGNAVNFAFDPNIGLGITILQGEIICAIHHLATSVDRQPHSILSLPQEYKEKIAELWLNRFV